MPIFDYKARTKDGKLITGKRLSQSEDTLGAQLFKEGIVPIDIRMVTPAGGYLDRLKTFFRGGGVSIDELGLFSRQMHALLKTGVPITAALRQLADNSRTAVMANALYGVVESLEGGRDLVNAIQDYPKIFTPVMISMLKVGQDSGRLEEAFLRLNQYLELEASGMKRIRTALRYPAIVLLAIVCAIVLINVLVIPSFAKMYAQANIELPTVTRMLMGFSNFVIAHWFVIFLFIGSIIAAIVYYFKTPTGKYNWYYYQLKIPQFGDILRRIVLLRFAQSFAITIESGIPLLEGLTLIAHTINNSYAEQEILNMCESIRHGKNLTQSAADSPLFTSLELQMLAVSEETGQLSQMFEEVANYYRREVDYDIKRFNDIIEPTLIVLLAGVVLFLALTVYLPMWDMVKMVRARS